MTKISPRIYLYKITFEEVPYYYYGVHKEKKFDEKYWGSPCTHKWMWNFYTPKKQILQFFDFIDEGWIEAQEVEKRIIKPFYQTDKWCLNENCGGKVSLSISRKNGKKTGTMHKKNKTGIFAQTPEQRSENGKKYGKMGAKKAKELGVGIFGMTDEERSEAGKKGAKKAEELGVGIFAITPEERSQMGKLTQELGIGLFSQTPEQLRENCRKGAEKQKRDSTGIFSFTKEQLSEYGKIGGKSVSLETRKKSQETHKRNGTGFYNLSPEERLKRSKNGGNRAKELGSGIHSQTLEEKQELGRKTSSQKWMCTETKYVSTPAGLSVYQNARGIDTSNRIRIL